MNAEPMSPGANAWLCLAKPAAGPWAAVLVAPRAAVVWAPLALLRDAPGDLHLAVVTAAGNAGDARDDEGAGSGDGSDDHVVSRAKVVRIALPPQEAAGDSVVAVVELAEPPLDVDPRVVPPQGAWEQALAAHPNHPWDAMEQAGVVPTGRRTWPPPAILTANVPAPPDDRRPAFQPTSQGIFCHICPWWCMVTSDDPIEPLFR